MNTKIRIPFLAVGAALLGLAASARAAGETYKIDPVHSSVAFSIRHFVSKVPGSFTNFGGTIIVDRDNLEKSSVEATIEVGSVNTANTQRDNHLEERQFFAIVVVLTAASSSYRHSGQGYCKAWPFRPPPSAATGLTTALAGMEVPP